MDEKHRQYCIKLGNPYMNDERYQKQYEYNQVDTFWRETPTMKNDNWIKNNKKFTN